MVTCAILKRPDLGLQRAALAYYEYYCAKSLMIAVHFSALVVISGLTLAPGYIPQAVDKCLLCTICRPMLRVLGSGNVMGVDLCG